MRPNKGELRRNREDSAIKTVNVVNIVVYMSSRMQKMPSGIIHIIDFTENNLNFTNSTVDFQLVTLRNES